MSVDVAQVSQAVKWKVQCCSNIFSPTEMHWCIPNLSKMYAQMRYCTTAESKDNKHTMQHELDIMQHELDIVQHELDIMHVKAANEQLASLLAQQLHMLQPHLG